LKTQLYNKTTSRDRKESDAEELIGIVGKANPEK